MDGSILLGRRKRKRVTQAQLARHLNLDHRTVSDIEAGRVEVTPATVKEWSEAIEEVAKEPRIAQTEGGADGDE